MPHKQHGLVCKTKMKGNEASEQGPWLLGFQVGCSFFWDVSVVACRPLRMEGGHCLCFMYSDSLRCFLWIGAARPFRRFSAPLTAVARASRVNALSPPMVPHFAALSGKLWRSGDGEIKKGRRTGTDGPWRLEGGSSKRGRRAAFRLVCLHASLYTPKDYVHACPFFSTHIVLFSLRSPLVSLPLLYCSDVDFDTKMEGPWSLPLCA